MSVDAARLRLVDLTAALPVTFGTDARIGRGALAERRSTSVVGPSGLEWRVGLMRIPTAVKPPRPSEMMAHADPEYGWTPLPIGIVLTVLVLPFLPFVLLLRSMGLIRWEVEARTYPWGRRYPPIVFRYAARGHDQAIAAVAELAAALALGSGAPVLQNAERVDAG